MVRTLVLAGMLAAAATTGAYAKPAKNLNCIAVGVISLGTAYIPGAQCNH